MLFSLKLVKMFFVCKQSVREDTHKKNVFFSGRNTKRVGGELSNKPLFFYNLEKMSKPHEPLSSRGGGYPDLSGTTTEKYTFLCVSSLSPGNYERMRVRTFRYIICFYFIRTLKRRKLLPRY